MHRRKFLKNSAAASVPFFLNGLPMTSLAMPASFSEMNGDSDKILILVQLGGGNDGLNTLIPLDQYDKLANMRPKILLPEDSLIQITGDNALNPAMTGAADLFNSGRLNIIQNVGYPDQNRSHFRSMDIWMSGSSSDVTENTGWLGRYFENRYADYPIGYPSGECPHPFALKTGRLVSPTCQGMAANFSIVSNNPGQVNLLPEGSDEALDLDTCYGFELDYIRKAIEQTNAYSQNIQSVFNAGSNNFTYPDTDLAEQLKICARLISGGMQTRVYIVTQGGYDTHASQVDVDNPGEGRHASLLRTLSDAMLAFQEDLKAQGLSERVLGMTFSEFGRQIRENGGEGTDHGTAAPMMVFGQCVNPGIIGDNPEIPTEIQNQTGLPMQYDYRSVYGSILMDWFEVPESEIVGIFGDEFQHLPIVGACDVTSTLDFEELEEIKINVFPNPASDWLTITFDAKSDWYRVSLYDAIGQEIKVLSDQQFSEGEASLKTDVRDLAAGNYFLRIQSKQAVKTKSIIVSH